MNLAAAVVDIRIHIDDLEFTREGLRTKDAIELQVGQHNRIVLVRPQRQPAPAAAYAGFPVASSFPGPAVLSTLIHEHEAPDGGWRLTERVERGDKIQIFGHADSVGSEADNDVLSKHRAESTLNLLVNNVDGLVEAAEREAWGVELQQVMLRALLCDPGPVDGIVGALTEAAVETFQTRYLEREFHQPDDRLRCAGLEIDGRLGQATVEALIDAYVSLFSPRLPPEAFVSEASVCGCSFHNPAGPEPAANRRISLVTHTTDPDYPQPVPCASSGERGCPAVDDGADHKCLWFREHVVELRYDDARHHHFSPAWLALAGGRYLLSVLTTVPETEDVEFEVFASSDSFDGPGQLDADAQMQSLGPVSVTRPVHGVAQVIWDAPNDFAPQPDGRTHSAEGSYVPIFRARHARTEAHFHDSYPASAIVVLFARERFEQSAEKSERLEFELLHDSGLSIRKSAREATPHDQAHLALRFHGLPETGLYSLVVHHGESIHRTVFEDVPYRDLAREPEPSKGAPPPSTCQLWVEAEPAAVGQGFGEDDSSTSLDPLSAL
ncbi:MAG: peptidoglycan-binding protein [Myxococcota bacterium]